MLRIINVPKRGIGLKTIENLTSKAMLNNCSIYDIIDSGKELQFKNIIEELKQAKDVVTLTELIDLIIDKTGIKEELISENTLEAEVRLENLEEFKSITRNFEEVSGLVSLEEFLEEISLVSDIEEHKNNSDVVTLMTIHSAKGLEFNNVFIAGMEEGIFPHTNSFNEISGIEEERRLCYVAVTRAKQKLYIVNARKRMLFGQENYNPPSRFISEIGEEYLDIDSSITNDENEIVIKKDYSSNFDHSIEFTIGDHVMHETFGNGIIVKVDKSIISIAFPHPIGIKSFMKGHKSIRKV